MTSGWGRGSADLAGRNQEGGQGLVVRVEAEGVAEGLSALGFVCGAPAAWLLVQPGTGGRARSASSAARYR